MTGNFPMKSRRTAKVAQAIMETVSSTVLFGLKDPRVSGVTVIGVDVSPDIRTAKVYVSIMGDDKQQTLCMHGLNSARGYIQSKCADRLQTRYTPVLTFVLDDSIKKSAEASRILSAVLPNSTATDGGERPPEDSPADGDVIGDDDSQTTDMSVTDRVVESN